MTLRHLDRNFAGPGMVCWQDKPARRGRPKAGLTTVLCALFALAAAVVLAGQMLGWLHWKGPLAFTPVMLMVVALNAQLIAMVRGFLGWLAG